VKFSDSGILSPAKGSPLLMAELKEEIAAYDLMRADLESASLGKWALVHDRKVVGIYESFDGAASEAVHRFGRGPYLIRQIGAPPVSMPVSVMYAHN
jgi:hypothetical protein